jgi:hypothetical protein
MGLSVDRFEFPHAPPSADELRAHLRDYWGSDYGLDAFEIEPHDGTYRGAPYCTRLYYMLHDRSHAYACAFLLKRGGIPVNYRTGKPKSLRLPAFVERPWRSWSWWQRLRFMFGFGVDHRTRS